MTLAYFPGCSLEHSSAEFDRATRRLLAALSVETKDIPDWTCCGSSPAHMMDHLLAQALAARNLRQASLVGQEMLVPCPSCYQREKNAEVEIHKSDEFRAEVNEVLERPYTGQVHRVRSARVPDEVRGRGEDRRAGQGRPLAAQSRPLLRLPAGPSIRPDRRAGQRAAHDDGPAAAGRRRRRQVVELQDGVLRRQCGHAQDGDPAAAERQGHPSRLWRPARKPSWCVARSATSTWTSSRRRSTSTWAPTTRCPSCTCPRFWASPWASASTT